MTEPGSGRQPLADERVQRALEGLLESGEIGVQVAAYLGEELIVDAWTGVADDAGTPVAADTLFPIFSASKLHITLLAHLWEERGLIGLDEPMTACWPEYARHGKGGITLRHVLTHCAGVPQMPQDLTLERLDDWEWIVGRLEDVEPLSPPGERTHYHGLSIYFLVGEVLRRTDARGRLFDVILREEVCQPLGIDDVSYRLPAGSESRAATLFGPADFRLPDRHALIVSPATLPHPAFQNRPEVRRRLGGNMYATARGGAKVWSLLANGGRLGGVRLLSEKRVRSLARPAPNASQQDEVLGGPAPWAVGGLQLPVVEYLADVVGPGPHVLTQHGGGGTLGWADLDSGLAVMYTHNWMGTATPFRALADVVRRVAAERGG